MKRKYSVDCYCQDDPAGNRHFKNYTITAQDSSEAESKADKRYKNEKGFNADTVEAFEVPTFIH